ncbi:2,3,4,5-tetrahydropyridine-2,6-dicarboxylate N-succinyltransferase [Rickettsiales endosymbiont of Paramecium tredecaurelia]|uniref:2,3,4,5-tetrahydropyridine-2,6-dicarboxylate N-succinyltransferase n=1 Tax=Candidatus Sarmatiella mevalonica TaxID=2770581 RepID=UPI001923B292|nr:2,3,4,5-tetrahydropyridine-2,6-dicarboxylate N-succinyltransferase [Candidatus Sarmatiella mevalonica]MBL3284993.1 2,3,4,5-tetrahydropyridine-2,6-dicarboxylate N-succinyltransferase [Candidatus Sarmatiella mevalonica]
MQSYNEIKDLEQINVFWDRYLEGGDLPALKQDIVLQELLEWIIEELNYGRCRPATKHPTNGWEVCKEVQRAILLYFFIKDCQISCMHNPSHTFGVYRDKIPLRFSYSNQQHLHYLQQHNIRIVMGSIMRNGSYIGANTVFMPSFVNIGAYVGAGSMIDTWSTIGSCAQIGENCHISGGTGIGGVLEPVGARPVIIEDNCFIGARSEVAEGMIVESGAVIGMGVFLSSSTKILDRETGAISYGVVPANAVVVSGSYNNLYCAVIVKRADAKTRSKVEINNLLRENH